jgi:hypothetical protein
MGRFDALLTIDTKKEPKAKESSPQAARTSGTGTPLPEPRAKSPAGKADREHPERSNARTPVRANGRRIITRNSFEIYEDQMDALRKLAMEEKLDGRLGSMSAMVREAIEQFLRDAAVNKAS